MEGGREGGREGEREEGREEGKEGGRAGGRQAGRQAGVSVCEGARVERGLSFSRHTLCALNVCSQKQPRQ